MPLTLLAVLLAFAAPAPMMESVPLQDDEAIIDPGRAGRLVRQDETVPPPSIAEPPSISPLPQVDAALPPRISDDWTPRLFSRPPPL